MLVAGVDEAGRGPAIGPLVVAAVVIEKQQEELLHSLGVKDSKQLTPKERERQYAELGRLVKECASISIEPHEIDALRDLKSLNEIEAMRIGALLNSLKNKPDSVYVDSPDPICRNFGERIKRYLSFNCRIIAEHKADVNYAVVSAASIIAKVRRDAAVKELEKVYGELGSGYPHDPLTVKFIKEFIQKNNHLPVCARKSWITSQRILDEKFQKKLF